MTKSWRWERPQSPAGVEMVVDDIGVVWVHNAPLDGQPINDDRWCTAQIRYTWAQLLSNVDWVEEYRPEEERA